MIDSNIVLNNAKQYCQNNIVQLSHEYINFHAGKEQGIHLKNLVNILTELNGGVPLSLAETLIADECVRVVSQAGNLLRELDSKFKS